MNKSAFSLIEIILSIALLLLAITSLNFLMNSGAKQLASLHRSNQATARLQAKMEEFRALSFDQLIALNGSSFADGKGRISILPISADLLSIKAELPPSSLAFYTFRSKY